jgi:predicted nucleotidyltransferase
MKFGLTLEELTLLDEVLVAPLKANGCEVWIFGSRTRGTHHRFSDIDILFRLSDGAKLPVGFLAEIIERLEESRLSYKVDLVDERDLTENYRANVMQEKIRL